MVFSLPIKTLAIPLYYPTKTLLRNLTFRIYKFDSCIALLGGKISQTGICTVLTQSCLIKYNRASSWVPMLKPCAKNMAFSVICMALSTVVLNEAQPCKERLGSAHFRFNLLDSIVLCYNNFAIIFMNHFASFLHQFTLTFLLFIPID